jgi:uncharacterized membrane protein YqaE (UPF0057 family)
MSAANRNKLEQKIDEMDWTLFDRLMYGGLGHGYFCLPTNLIRIIATVLFPPIATILKHLKLSTEFPYITMESLVYLLKNVDDILYSFILTALFYIPGLIYGLSNIKCAELGEDVEELKDVTEADIKQHFEDIKTMNRIKRGNGNK